MARWSGWTVVVAVVLLLMPVGGCSGKKKGADLGAEGGQGLGEESLGGGGSLAQAQRGGLGSETVTGPLSDIHFDYDSFELDDGARDTLQGHASWLRDNSESRVEIEGHCDDRGTVEYNLALGAKRAAAVKSYLTSLGIPSDRITTISYGEELPICHEATESCWHTNRRAHFVVIGR
jgi:peptidoglycan-associated lipoprotein